MHEVLAQVVMVAGLARLLYELRALGLVLDNSFFLSILPFTYLRTISTHLPIITQILIHDLGNCDCIRSNEKHQRESI